LAGGQVQNNNLEAAMSKQLFECDFSTENVRGFTWFKNHQGTGTVTLIDSGHLEFSGRNHKIYVENIGTAKEKVTVVEIE
jgi:hypothetical protein